MASHRRPHCMHDCLGLSTRPTCGSLLSVLVRCLWLSVERPEAPSSGAEEDEDDEGEDEQPVMIGHGDEHPDIAERRLFCRVLASEEIKRLKEPTLQENQRVRVQWWLVQFPCT